VRDVAGGYLSHHVGYLESWKTEDLRRFIVSEEGAESGRRDDQILGYFRWSGLHKVVREGTRYSGRIVLETLNTSVVGNEISIFRCVTPYSF
jgi:hypothetical protein